MRLNLARSVAALGFGLLSGVSLVAAQDLWPSATHRPAADTLQIGEYRDLNFWRTIRLGMASFFNPELARNAQIAYTYPVAHFTEADLKTLEDLAAKGIVVTGKVSGSDFVAVGSNAENLSVKQVLTAKPGDWVLVSSEPALAGDTGTAVVAWDPRGAVNALASMDRFGK